MLAQQVKRNMTATELVDEKAFLKKLKIIEPKVNHLRIGPLMDLENVKSMVPAFMHAMIASVENSPSWLIIKQSYQLSTGDKKS